MKSFYKVCAMLTIFLTMVFAFHSQAQTGAGGQQFSQEYTYDFAKSGGAVGFISLLSPARPLPLNAVVTSAHYQVLTAFTSGGSATVAIGDAASGTKYLAATAYNNAAYTANVPAALTSGVPQLISTANIRNVGITVGTAALTGGKMRVVLMGYVPRGQ